MNLTNREFWRTYWADFEPGIVADVGFSDLFDRLPGRASKFIEIGGFPGKFSVYFNKFKGYDVTLLDFYIDSAIIKLEKINSLKPGTIKTIEADFFSFKSETKYDIVFSSGFVEHFEDTKDILRRHYDLLAPGGILFVTMPNFRGLNGLVQRLLHRSNFDAHNTSAMNIKLIRKYCLELGHNPEIFYYGRPCLWIEPKAKVSPVIRKLARMLSIVISRIPAKNRILSPHIVIFDKLQS
jgi:SAM-dependent methyltransferase